MSFGKHLQVSNTKAVNFIKLLFEFQETFFSLI